MTKFENSNYSFNAVKDHQLTELLHFYLDNQNIMVRPRPEKLIKDAVENGAFFDIEDYELNILGAGGIYEYLEHQYIELGSTQILDRLQGYGLHKLFIATRVLNILLLMPPGDSIFCTIKAGNEISIRSIQKMGFSPWTPPEELILERCRLLNLSPAKDGDVIYMRFIHTPENMAKVAGEFLDFLLHPFIWHRKNEKDLMILHINHTILTSESVVDELQKMAA